MPSLKSLKWLLFDRRITISSHVIGSDGSEVETDREYVRLPFRNALEWVKLRGESS